MPANSNSEETGAWPADYEPPSLEELGSVWEETGGIQAGATDVGGLTALT